MFDQPDGQRIGRSLGAGLLTELVVVGMVLLVMSLLPKRVYQAVLRIVSLKTSSGCRSLVLVAVAAAVTRCPTRPRKRS
jgi:hypothetical protein